MSISNDNYLKKSQKYKDKKKDMSNFARHLYESVVDMGRSNKILGWEGVGNRQLFCFFKV
jgi:hypothetical protein